MSSYRIVGEIMAVALRTTACAQTSAKVDARDPLQVIAQSFPKTIEFKDKGRVLEFCPDNTCDGFVRSEGVPIAELEDFALLYTYFFSDFIYLKDFRKCEDVSQAVDDVLSRPAYRECRSANSKGSARCALIALSRVRRTRLIFVRYDEKRRSVVNENIAEQLARKESQSP
jgi:hypothetical protein